ncbi:hypothetical protein [Bacillus kexueae]|uniref:hypothetical protein n=1 Tax=Aeribacillus kexueae TaxID=2078952 RepID=UPI001FAFE719|nr:hypothetical protein [Bacillus kexueae]
MDFFLDFVLVGAFVIGLTATMGVIANTVGTKIFGQTKFRKQSLQTQKGWNKVQKQRSNHH